MSLLLDALKRAEQEKLAKQGERFEPPRRETSSMPAATPASAASLELAPLNSPSAAASAQARAAADRARSEAASAQNVFQAKDAPAPERSRKGLVIGIALVVVLLAIAGAGIYIWLAVQSFTPRVAASARPRPQQIAPPPPQAASEPAPRLDMLLVPPPQQPSAAIQPPPVAEVKKVTPTPIPSTREPRETLATLLRDAPGPAATPPLKLSPASEKPQVPQEVAAGYESLRSGDLAGARRSYSAALAADPSNVDALLGTATLEARSGNRMLAASAYRRALDIDPRNATALAGLASLADYTQPEGIESQLRGEIARDPQSPQLHFTLGNLYASQSRWNEAQLEFFEAHRYDPGNADIVFNLAVSLDRIGQPKLAADNYRRALDAARRQAVQFDPAGVERRLAQMKP